MNKNELKKLYTHLNEHDAASAFSLLQKVARKSSKEEFKLFVYKKEMPSIKLTNKEMELAKGGWFFVALAIMEAAAIIYSAGKGIYDGCKGNTHGEH